MRVVKWAAQSVLFFGGGGREKGEWREGRGEKKEGGRGNMERKGDQGGEGERERGGMRKEERGREVN